MNKITIDIGKKTNSISVCLLSSLGLLSVCLSVCLDLALEFNSELWVCVHAAFTTLTRFPSVIFCMTTDLTRTTNHKPHEPTHKIT